MPLWDKLFGNERIEPFTDEIGENGFGAPFHIAFEYRELPGSGARQYAYETLSLPMDTPIGNAVANVDSFDAYGSPIVGWEQTYGIESLIYNGNYSGQVTSTPLFNVDSVDNSELLVNDYFNNNDLP